MKAKELYVGMLVVAAPADDAQFYIVERARGAKASLRRIPPHGALQYEGEARADRLLRPTAAQIAISPTSPYVLGRNAPPGAPNPFTERYAAEARAWWVDGAKTQS